MRRIIVNSKSDLNQLEQLKLDYQAFKTLHPEAYARAPLEIKVLAKAANEAGFSVRQIAETIGLAIPSIYAWFHSLEKKKAKATPAGRDQLASQQILNKTSAESKKIDLASFKKLIAEYQAAEASQKASFLSQLGKHVRELLATEAYTIESLAKATGAHPLTIRAWMKAPIETTESEPEVLVEEPGKPQSVSEESLPVTVTEIPSQESDWVRVRLGGHVLELAWMDLLKKLPLQDLESSLGKESPVAKGQEQRLAPHYFQLPENANYDDLMAGFERCIIQRALERHHSIALAAASLELSRSTFDNRRRKLGLLGKEHD